MGQIAVESQGDPNAVSSDGQNSIGLLQVTPKYFYQSDGFETVEDFTTALKNPEFNLATGIGIMESNLKNYGTITRALEAYNTGKPEPGNWDYALAVLNAAVDYV